MESLAAFTAFSFKVFRISTVELTAPSATFIIELLFCGARFVIKVDERRYYVALEGWEIV